MGNLIQHLKRMKSAKLWFPWRFVFHKITWSEWENVDRNGLKEKKINKKKAKYSGIPESKPRPGKEGVPDPRAAKRSLSCFKGMECFTLTVMEFNKNYIGEALRKIFEGMKLNLDKEALFQGLEQTLAESV